MQRTTILASYILYLNNRGGVLLVTYYVVQTCQLHRNIWMHCTYLTAEHKRYHYITCLFSWAVRGGRWSRRWFLWNYMLRHRFAYPYDSRKPTCTIIFHSSVERTHLNLLIITNTNARGMEEDRYVGLIWDSLLCFGHSLLRGELYSPVQSMRWAISINLKCF